jgi:molybdopterin converting factor small subunit
MSVTVRVPTILRAYLNDQASVDISPEENTLHSVFATLEAHAPGILQRVVSDSGELRRFVNVYVNDDDVRTLQGLDTPTPDGCSISIVPAVAGGC